MSSNDLGTRALEVIFEERPLFLRPCLQHAAAVALDHQLWRLDAAPCEAQVKTAPLALAFATTMNSNTQKSVFGNDTWGKVVPL
eukprot:3174823-Amphidinium_carterae.1